MTQYNDAAQRSAHVARGGEDHGRLQAWAEDAIRTGRARLPVPHHAQAVLQAAAAWRAAVRAADDALSYAADVSQGIEPGSKKAAHQRATDLETLAGIAMAEYDRAVEEAAKDG